MQLHVNPHVLVLIGENSFIRLSTDGGKTVSTRCSHWRVLWTPAGAVGANVAVADDQVAVGQQLEGGNPRQTDAWEFVMANAPDDLTSRIHLDDPIAVAGGD